MVKGARRSGWLSITRESWPSITPESWLSITRESWLSITPEPERELPWAVAALAQRGRPSPQAVADETARVEHLVLHGSQRAWLRYLHGVVELIDSRAADTDADVQRASALASAVISNHHNLLLGLPGRGAQLSAADRLKLTRLRSTTSK